MYVPITVKLIVLPSNRNAEGQVPIMLQFIQNRKVRRISLRKWIYPSDWLNEGATFVKERGRGAPAYAREINVFLSNIINRANKIILEFQAKDITLSFHQFKKEIISLKSQDFLKFCEEELAARKAAKSLSPATLKQHHAQLNKLRSFRKTISFPDITINFLEDYKNFLRVEFGNDVNTIFTSMKYLRSMLNLARRREISDVYPFSNYKIEYKKDTRARLSTNEVEVLHGLYDKNTLPQHLQDVLQYFLFACYTGLSWSDLVNLKYSDIEKRGKKYIIHKRRLKTDQLFIVPLIRQAKQLIDLETREGKVFPDILTNQKANFNLKKIIATTQIRKNVSFHVARHTFATIALNNGIPREVVQKMLGHAKSEQTELYSKVLDTYVIKEMSKWDSGNPSKSEVLNNLCPESQTKYKRIRAQLVSARIIEGHSEIDTAKVIDVKEEDYKKMEKGELQFGLGDLLALAQFLDLDLKVLFEEFF